MKQKLREITRRSFLATGTGAIAAGQAAAAAPAMIGTALGEGRAPGHAAWTEWKISW